MNMKIKRTYVAAFTAEDGAIRLNIDGRTDRMYEKFESRDYLNMVTIAPMSSDQERAERAFIGLSAVDLVPDLRHW